MDPFDTLFSINHLTAVATTHKNTDTAPSPYHVHKIENHHQSIFTHTDAYKGDVIDRVV